MAVLRTWNSTLFTLLSGMYAILITVIGAVLPISEVFADRCHYILTEIFNSYLYLVSIAFLLYTYTYLLRTKKWKLPRPRLSSFRSPDPPATPINGNALMPYKHRRMSVHEVHTRQTSSFYLRLGAVAFGIGSMIHNGLEFGMYFDSHRNVAFAISTILHFIFTFMQLYFVFKNSKLSISRFKTLARFGLMHMVATNIVVWFSNIIDGTLLEIEEYKYSTCLVNYSKDAGSYQHTAYNNSSPQTEDAIALAPLSSPNHTELNGTDIGYDVAYHFKRRLLTTASEESGELGAGFMRDLMETASPYLYPCSIEYSLISAGVLYIMWRHVGVVAPDTPKTPGEDTRPKLQRMSVDCSHSSRGLFLGISVIVITITTMIVFLVLVATDTHRKTAIFLEHLSEIFIYIVSSAAIIMAFRKMKQLRFITTKKLDLEETLLMISVIGIYIYAMFSIIAALFDPVPYGNALIIISSSFDVIQATLQTVFLITGLRRVASKPEHEQKKPGREFVMFLLISNIALWAINAFEVQRADANPVQIHYYGPLAWNILVHISVPLSIFFRFHSTVCISNIWKTAWKRKF